VVLGVVVSWRLLLLVHGALLCVEAEQPKLLIQLLLRARPWSLGNTEQTGLRQGNFPLISISKYVGVLDTGVSRSTCVWASSTAQLQPRGEMTTEAIGEDSHEEVPHEENDDQNY
jgi:hypothetical protein